MGRQTVTADVPAARPLDTTATQYAAIRQHLLEGKFPPGTLLLETALSTTYGASRTPIREALGRLAQDGLIERATRGFRVRARTPDEIIEIYDARTSLESTCAALAADRHSNFDMARLTHLIEERRAATVPKTFGELNNAWHLALRVAAHNGTIYELLERLDNMLLIYKPTRPQVADDRSVDHHDEILEAIRARDAEAAERTMRDHLRHMRDRRIASLLQDADQR